MKKTSLLLAILWTLLVVAIYYWIHKPISPYLVRGFGGAVLDVLTASIMVWVSGGIGRRVLRAILADWQRLSRPEQIAGEAIVGLGLLGVAVFVVGLVMLNFLSVIAILILLSVLAGRHLWGWFADLWAWRRVDPQIQWQRGLLGFVGFNLLMALTMAVAPPSTAFDSLTYHLVGAKLAVQDGQFSALPDNHFFGFPQLVNTLYASHMALLDGRFVGVSVLHWMFGGLFLLAMGGYAARRFNNFVGWLSVAFIFTATSIWLQFSWAYVDLFTTACAILMFIALDEWRTAEPTQKRRWLIACGIFVGLAMSSKYNALILGVLAGLYILWYERQISWGRAIQSAAVMVLVASVVLLPWLLRNLAFYDNPVYPFGPHTGEWDSFVSDWYTSADRAPLRQTPLFVAPILLMPTFLGIQGGVIYDATIGPIFLLMIPLLLLSWRQLNPEWKDRLRGLLSLVLLMHLVWLGTAAWSIYGGQIRFMYPMFGWLAILAAVAVDGLRLLPTKPLHIGWVIRTVVGLVLVFAAVDNFTGTRPRNDEGILEGTTRTSHFLDTRALEFAFGVIDQHDYLEHRLGWHIVAIERVNDLPEGARVLFLWETRSLYCDESKITCLEDTALYRWWHTRRIVGDGQSDTIYQSWLADGVTHVLVWETGREAEMENVPFFTTEDIEVWDKMVTLLGEPLWQGEDIYTLYEVSLQAVAYDQTGK